MHEAWSTESFAEDAVALLDDLHVDTAHVYGTSMGGRIGQMLAIRHPARVGRLVLACTSPGGRLARERDGSVRRLLADPDRMTPASNAELIADRIPDATVQITERGRHGFFDEFRDEVTASVLDFLSQ